MPLQATSGAASYDAFGGGVPVVPNYIEDVFNVWVYPGSNSATSINNGIDLAGKGGLVWTKGRTGSADNHLLIDTVRGVNKPLRSNETGGQYTETTLTAFNSNGYSITGGNGDINLLNRNYVSWTFREAPKFFDVVTYTGNGSARTIAHNLGSVPGCIIIKRTSAAADWTVYHRSTGNAQATSLNTTQAASASTAFNSTDPTSTVFSLGSGGAGSAVNANGQTYVAYIFAHDAGGFGLTATDNVISCGSVSVTNGSYATVNLGYEPQFVILKASSTTGNWFMNDSMRSMPAQPSLAASLSANTSTTEVADDGPCFTTSTGFTVNNNNVTGTYIYIAIRRGPMKVPTDATKVFAIDTRNATTPSFVSNFPVDMSTYRAKSGSDWYLQSRLTPNYLFTNSTAAEAVGTVFSTTQFAYNTGWGSSGASIPDLFSYMFQRAPSFFDEVCETSTSATNKPVTHNLAAVPELIIVKKRSASGTNWVVYASAVTTLSQYLVLNTTAARATSSNIWGLSSPTTTTFNINEHSVVGSTGSTYVAYLFASCPGVSKVGSYTGTGTTKQVDCGFTGGARFVLIKRTDSTGDWYVWDSARGIVSGNDPYLLLNSTAAEVTSTDYIDTYSAGFEISSTAPAAINASGGTFIFLAIA